MSQIILSKINVKYHPHISEHKKSITSTMRPSPTFHTQFSFLSLHEATGMSSDEPVWDKNYHLVCREDYKAEVLQVVM